MHLQGDFRKPPFGFRVITAHQEPVVQGDLGHDDTGARNEFTSAETEFAQAGVLYVEDFEEGAQPRLREVGARV